MVFGLLCTACGGEIEEYEIHEIGRVEVERELICTGCWSRYVMTEPGELVRMVTPDEMEYLRRSIYGEP